MSDELPDNLPAHLVVGDPVGAGGTASVWRARDRRRGRDVAVKVLRLDPGDGEVAVGRLVAEARALARLGDRDDLAPLRAAGVDGRGVGWLVCDLVDGPTLAERLPAAPLGPAGTVLLLDRLAGALAAVHAAGVVHGDVSPANVVMHPDRGAVLVDFGLAALGDGRSATGGAADGITGAVDRAHTPGYAAPERLRGGPVSASGDIYALGATVWAAACGRPPAGPDLTPPPEVPASVAELVAACTAGVPGRRPTAAALVARRGRPR